MRRFLTDLRARARFRDAPGNPSRSGASRFTDRGMQVVSAVRFTFGKVHEGQGKAGHYYSAEVMPV